MQQVAVIKAPTNLYKQDGKQKRYYRECGKLMQNDTGDYFILADKYFNMASVPSDPDKSHVALQLEWITEAFKIQQSKPKQQKPRQSSKRVTKTAQNAAEELLKTPPFDDEIVF